MEGGSGWAYRSKTGHELIVVELSDGYLVIHYDILSTFECI